MNILILQRTFWKTQYFLKGILNLGELNNGAYKVAFGNDTVIIDETNALTKRKNVGEN